MDRLTLLTGCIAAALSLALSAWMLALWLRDRGINPFRAVAKFLPRSAVERLILACVAFGFFHYGATKETNAPPRGASVECRVESVELRSGQSCDSTLSTFNSPFRLESVTTNDSCSFSAPPGASVHERWLRRGAADDWFQLSPTGWTFALGDTSVTNLRVFSCGRARLPGGTELSPLPATLGVVPEGNWSLLGESGVPSLFWHSLSSDGALLLTWQNVLLHRAATNSVSFQAELRPTGGVTFRYDLSRLASDDLILGVVPTAGDAALDGPLTRSTTRVSFKSRDEAICDEARAVFEEALDGLDPFSFPEGSTNTVLEHLFYSGTTNGAFAYPQPTEHTAVLRVSVSGTGTGDLLVGGSYVPLVGVIQRRGAETQSSLALPVAKGATVPTYLRGDGTLSVSFDSGEFAFGELPDIASNCHVGWINFPNTKATEPCVHDFRRRKRVVSLPVGSGADDLACYWSGAANVGIENHPPRSATLTASFDARETREITYTLSHPNRLFGQTEYSQTVRFCPRPPNPDPADPDPPEDPSWFAEGDPPDEDDDDIEYIDESDPAQPGGAPVAGDEDEVCPVHEVPYEQCASLHAVDYTNAVQNAAHLSGVLYLRDPPVVGDQIYLEVPNEHVNCCGCPDHWTNCVSVAYQSSRISVTGPGGLDFSSTDVSCTVDVAGVRPSLAVGDAGLAFARNGEIYERRGYTVFGVDIRRDGVPLSRYNELNSQFGLPMAVCTNDWRAPTLELVTNVRLPSGTVHLEFAGANAPFALWYWNRGESEYRKLLDSETCPAKDIPIAAWRSVVAGVASGSAAAVPVLVTSSAPGTVRLVLRYWTVADGAFAQDEAVQRITSVNPPLLADADGDWSLGEGDVAAQLAGRTFRFWTNEDCHKGDYVGQSSDFAPNAADYVVNGRLDLVNLFPVKLDLKPFVDAWGQGATFILWSPSSGSLRFCGLDAHPDEAWAYQTNDVYTTTGDPVYAADLIPVAGEGEEIDPDDYLGLGNAPGVLAFEAAREVSRPDALMLLVMDGDDVLFTYSLPLAVRSVHDMYSWIGARHLSGEAEYRSTVVNRMWEGEAVKSLMFLHGANVSGAAAQEWGDAVFKRLWLSGAKIEFYNVDWRSDIGNDANYHANVSNAFVVASQLAPILSNIQGDKVIMAHSLGNMVVSSMIQDYGLVPFCYLMCNSAVPAEAYDDDLSLRVPQLVHPEWEAYPTNSWTSSWHWLFRNELNDDRRLLGWPRRFSNVAQYAVNFYSTGDEILELAAVNNLWPTTGIWGDNAFGHLSWHKQELFKGRGIGVGMGATDWSGWNIEENLLGVNKISVAESLQMGEEDFKTNTVFYCYPSSMNQPTIPLLVRGAHLAQGIPALTPAAGRVAFGGEMMEQKSFNCHVQIDRPNGWPERSGYQGQWCHSDLKDVAHFYVFMFYDKVIEKGCLK